MPQTFLSNDGGAVEFSNTSAHQEMKRRSLQEKSFYALRTLFLVLISIWYFGSLITMLTIEKCR